MKTIKARMLDKVLIFPTEFRKSCNDHYNYYGDEFIEAVKCCLV